ncbi:MAG: biotin/lipoate--protein ligase family protein [Hyphomicrobiaceae bacterium]
MASRARKARTQRTPGSASAARGGAPRLPPLLVGHGVDATKDPFETAHRRAAEGRLGAGDVVWSRDPLAVRMAIVLEPEVGLEASLQMVPLLMVAVGDSLGVLLPAQIAITFRWPDAILINGGVAGHVRVAVPPSLDGAGSREAAPDWLVVGLSIQLSHDDSRGEPGQRPGETALVEEGGGALSPVRVIESVAGHFLAWLDIWQDDGFRPVHDAWFFRAVGRESDIEIADGERSLGGRVLGLDEGAGLILKPPSGQAVCLSLLARLPALGGRQPS